MLFASKCVFFSKPGLPSPSKEQFQFFWPKGQHQGTEERILQKNTWIFLIYHGSSIGQFMPLNSNFEESLQVVWLLPQKNTMGIQGDPPFRK